MGIQGLSTYLRENRRFLGKSLKFSSTAGGEPTPVVVDGWGFIYHLYLNEHSNLARSWVYGGEYESFSQIVKTVCKSLIDVGLKLYFVFDGPSPRLKFDTIVNRIVQSRVQPSLLFFRTSPISRATPRFLAESCCINPTQCYTACVLALQDMAGSTDGLEVHFADEEADPYMVELAGRLGAYVLGLDSDFVVFAQDHYLGYVPFDELVWHAQDSNQIATDAEPHADDDFQVVRRSKATKSPNTPTSRIGIVPPEITTDHDLTLSVEYYSPLALASHLNLPISLLPLLGAFLGNDYSKHSVASDRNPRTRFFDRGWTSAQKIERVASTIRSILNSSSQRRRPKQVSGVVELIERTVRILLERSVSSLGSTEIQRIVDGIVEATLPYAIPKPDTPTAGLWPTEFCTLHTPDVCPMLPIFSTRIAHLASSLGEEHDAVKQQDTIRRLYIAAYRKGDLSPQVMDILNTASYWPKLFLESPDVQTVSVSFGRRIREWGYSILDDAVGIPDAFVGGENEGEADVVSQSRGEDEDELVDVVEESDEDTLTDAERYAETQSSSSQTSRTPRPKVVYEYVRRGARVARDQVTVLSLADWLDPVSGFDPQNALPLQLRPDQERMHVLLCALKSDTPLVQSLSAEHLSAALTLRWVLQCAHAQATESMTKEKERWTRHEARSFLASFSWSTGEAVRESTTTVPIENRNIQLMAQLLMTFESIEHLSQILLLADSVPSSIRLFSGKRCHAYWTRVDRFGEDAVPPGLWEACTEGLEEGVFLEVKQKSAKKSRAKSEAAPVAKTAAGDRQRRGLFALLDDVEASA